MEYKSQPARIPQSAQQVISRFDDLSRLQDLMAQLPQDRLSEIGDISFEPDAIIINTPQLGAITLKVIERSRDTVVMSPASTPVPLRIIIHVAEVTPESCDLQVTVDVDIPPMLRPLIGGKMQQVADQMGQMIANLASAKS